MAYILTESDTARLTEHRAQQSADQLPSWSDLAATVEELGIDAVLALRGEALRDATQGAADRRSTKATDQGNRR